MTTGTYNTEIEIAGRLRPALIEYDDHHSGIDIVSVVVSREVRNTYTPDGRFLLVDHIVTEITDLFSDDEKSEFAAEIREWMRSENEILAAELAVD